jgi:hypothetical protein
MGGWIVRGQMRDGVQDDSWGAGVQKDKTGDGLQGKQEDNLSTEYSRGSWIQEDS